MDDLQQAQSVKDKRSVGQQVQKAVQEGEYPGWDKDTKQKKPLVFTDQDGKLKLKKSRTKTAESRLGRQMVWLFHDDHEDIDFNLLVSGGQYFEIC